MYKCYIQTQSQIPGYINPSWDHTPKKDMSFRSEDEAIQFCKYLAAYLNVVCRLTAANKSKRSYLISKNNKIIL